MKRNGRAVPTTRQAPVITARLPAFDMVENLGRRSGVVNAPERIICAGAPKVIMALGTARS